MRPFPATGLPATRAQFIGMVSRVFRDSGHLTSRAQPATGHRVNALHRVVLLHVILLPAANDLLA